LPDCQVGDASFPPRTSFIPRQERLQRKKSAGFVKRNFIDQLADQARRVGRPVSLRIVSDLAENGSCDDDAIETVLPFFRRIRHWTKNLNTASASGVICARVLRINSASHNKSDHATRWIFTGGGGIGGCVVNVVVCAFVGRFPAYLLSHGAGTPERARQMTIP